MEIKESSTFGPQRFMQSYVNNVNKETIEEKHAHIETPGLVRDQGKTHYGENLTRSEDYVFNIFFVDMQCKYKKWVFTMGLHDTVACIIDT